jgi:enterochelin esterase-like enzyme
MRKLTPILLCLAFFSGCGNTSEIPETAKAQSQSEETVTTLEETEIETEESEAVSDIGIQGILGYFAGIQEFKPDAGFDQKRDGVEYGEYTEIEYYSNTTGNTRKAFVYTPPGYDPNKTYPVLYLLHGIGGTHTEWNGGKPNEIISNLIAAGEAPPMLAVVPNARAMYDDRTPSNIFGEENVAAFDNFINDLRDDLMPFINENYPVSQKREDTAIAGLSMGGREALFIGISMPEVFAYVGAFCPAPGLMGENLGVAGQLAPKDMTLPDEYKGDTFIMIQAGNQDGVVGDNPKNYSDALSDNGVEHIYYSIDGGHDFNVWKNGLYYFVKAMATVISTD